MKKYVIKNEFCNVSLDEFSKNIEKVLLNEFPNYFYIGKENKIIKDIIIGQRLDSIEVECLFDLFEEAKARLPKNSIKYDTINSCCLLNGYSIYSVQLKSNKKDKYKIQMLDCEEDFVDDIIDKQKRLLHLV